MNKNILIVSFGAMALVCGALAYQLSRERGELRRAAAVQTVAVAATAQATGELEALRARNRELEATVRDLQGEVSLLQAGRAPGPGAKAGSLPPTLARAMLAKLLGKPETVGLAMDWIKADQRGRFAALIARQTQLSAAQREELRTLLADRYASRLDLASADIGELSAAQRQELDAEYHQKLVALVGAEEAGLFERAESKPVSADRLQRLEDRLLYEAEPLAGEQYTALWPVLSSGVFYYKLPADEASLAALVRQREEANAKVLAQAQALLQPAQYRTLEGLLHDDAVTWQVQMQVALSRRSAKAGGTGTE